MSAPFVSGAAALLQAASGNKLTSVQLRDLLVSTAEPVASLAGKSSSGGVLRVDAALKMANLPHRRSPPPPQLRVVTSYTPCKKGAKGCWNRCTYVEVKGKQVKRCAWVKTIVKASRRLLWGTQW